jgi:hypothetical protein
LGTEVAPDSDHLDSEDEVPTGRKRQVSKATLEKQKLAAKKKAKKHKDDDDDYEDDGDEYTALSKSFWTSKSSNAKPSVGSLEKCAKCSKQFTVVRSLGVMVMWMLIMICEDQIHDCCRPSTRLSLPPLRQGIRN